MNQDGLDLVIKRTFTRAEMSASSWFLDGRVCTQEDVISIVSKLKVQPDNLFQFNPQNSLGDLGLMRGSERLQEVVRSIGVAELFESHQKLIELDERLDGYGSKSESEEEIAQINLCIEKLASSWSTELEPVVAKVSEIYKGLIGRIVSDGEVVLVRLNRFKDWRLDVRAKFRDDDDMVTVGVSASLGELIFTTFCFLVALCEIANSPIVIIDEFNRGLHPETESLCMKSFFAMKRTKRSQVFMIFHVLPDGIDENDFGDSKFHFPHYYFTEDMLG